MDGGNEPSAVRVRVVAESPDVVSSLMEGWGESGPLSEGASRQKTLTVGQMPVLVRVQVSFQWPPDYTRRGKWDPTPFLVGADAILLVYREDNTKTFDFLKGFCKAVRPRHIFRAVTTAVLGLHDEPHTEPDTKARKLAMSIGAASTYRLSGGGTPVGFDAVLEGLAGNVGERYAVVPPYRVVVAEYPRLGGQRPSFMRRMFLWCMD